MYPKKIKLTLTRRDFKGKDYKEPFDCPIATGLKRKFPKAEEVGVAFHSCSIEHTHYNEVTDFAKYDAIQPLIDLANKNKKVGKLKLIFERI